jgi:hypothetical protein
MVLDRPLGDPEFFWRSAYFVFRSRRAAAPRARAGLGSSISSVLCAALKASGSYLVSPILLNSSLLNAKGRLPPCFLYHSPCHRPFGSRLLQPNRHATLFIAWRAVLNPIRPAERIINPQPKFAEQVDKLIFCQLFRQRPGNVVVIASLVAALFPRFLGLCAGHFYHAHLNTALV